MNAEIVPFGKHKGQPVEVLLADPGYREWILAQPWVRDRYPTFHQTIINYGGEPAETPEHNQMQAAFLSDELCIALARKVLTAHRLDHSNASRLAAKELPPISDIRDYIRFEWDDPRIPNRVFESEGWDVVFDIAPSHVYIEIDRLPACICECSHRDCDAESPCQTGESRHPCKHRMCTTRTTYTMENRLANRYNYAEYQHCNPACPWKADRMKWFLEEDEDHYYGPESITVRVECKPDLADDFPAVLRQVKSHGAGDWRDCSVVIVRRWNSQTVTWDQAAEMFLASKIILVAESAITAPPDDS